MNMLGDFYTDFSRIDLDTRGGYSRVSDVECCIDGKTTHRAFKLMRHEIDFPKGMERFLDELRLLTLVTQKESFPAPVTRVYDSGFVSAELSHTLHKQNTPSAQLEIISTGVKVDAFLHEGESLQAKMPGQWLPYLGVELAPYDDSLLRQIHHQPSDDPLGLYRLPTGEVIVMAVELLDVMDYLHKELHRAYMDWKPEHIFWNGLNKQVKLIDWNVTTALKDGPGAKQNIRDDIRLFCGAALYISLTFIDPDDPLKPIGPRPTTDVNKPIQQIRRRYWTDNPNFYQRGTRLDDGIKRIIQKGLDPNLGYESPQELKTVLIEYAQRELGLSPDELKPGSAPQSDYFKALATMRAAQRQLLDAQQLLVKATKTQGKTLEFTRLFESIKHALMNFPLS